MRGLPEAEPGPHTRTRRWDAVILGTALPGLVAAVRLGMRGARVLVIEEEAAARAFPGRREPFWMGGTGRGSVLGACLRAFGVPLIDQRRIETDPLAFQVALPTARLDVGAPHLSADEWVAWGLAVPEQARSLVAALADAAAAEAQALLDAPWVRSRPRRRASALAGEPAPAAEPPGPRPPRGLPPALRSAPPRLAYVLAAQSRALCHAGAREPRDEELARLLGAPLEGGAVMRGADAGLRAILRRRIESLYGEFRSVGSPFRLLSANSQPGVAPDGAGESGELWVGRVFVLNAPLAALATAVAQEPVPEPLQAPPPRRRRLCLHLRAERDVLPDAMAARVIIVGDEARPPEGTNAVALRRFPGGGDAVDLLASAEIDADDVDLAAREAEIAARVTSLLPFAGGRLVRVRATEPRWDDDAWLGEPLGGAGWPDELEVRLPTRQPLYHLDRAAVGGLGYEGELLLGWRAGDAIAADLA